jgi:tRNA A37 threonylcarbamoyladenosine synthetase subunit TsaC/SUA5/YrdC
VTVALDARDADRLQDCMTAGGLAVLPTDTVYGICCDPDDDAAARRLYELKGRPAARSCAIMFFALGPALQALGELPSAERAALQALLPGPVTVLIANRGHRFTAACRSDPETLGLRVPRLQDTLAALSAVDVPVM